MPPRASKATDPRSHPRWGRRLAAAVFAVGLTASLAPAAAAGGNGPDYNGHETINTSILHTYDELAAELEKQDARQEALELEVIGQSVKGRDLFLAKYVNDPANPTILFLTQQHGNEQLTTEGALEFIKHLGSARLGDTLEHVNVLIVPMLNPDGAMGDVDFSLDDYVASGDRHLTRYNAVGADLNRDHVDRVQPETRALHEKVLGAYEIDYMIDLHHQGTRSARDGQLVSGSILHPTTPEVDPDVLEGSKRLGAVVFDAVDSTGWGHLGKYAGGDATTISRNGVAVEYGISTLLFEMRGMSDHEYEPYVLGQKSNGYLRQQTLVTLEAAVQSIADGSIESADTSFWDTLAEQEWMPRDE
ncbi:M14 family zinc carboxypeptidase [Zhihengliuella sp.]|uniref:M14 family zinc carboxypeptidase n=1 Tax=Zhihengliuella sp. TaxID=1954483 RepID=UPI0028121779|nr:M14 family zinc carboxypeptidase [Zhihengliuella sp.]